MRQRRVAGCPGSTGSSRCPFQVTRPTYTNLPPDRNCASTASSHAFRLSESLRVGSSSLVGLISSVERLRKNGSALACQDNCAVPCQSWQPLGDHRRCPARPKTFRLETLLAGAYSATPQSLRRARAQWQRGLNRRLNAHVHSHAW